jgi:sarcosine oxidase subunit beta
MDGAEARSAFPLLSETVIASNYCSKDGFADPLRITPAYLEAAKRLGARVHSFTPVTDISQSASTYMVGSKDERWCAPIVINAAGAWIGQVCTFLSIDLQMSPCAIQMHMTAPTAPIMPHLVQHVSKGLSVKQVDTGNIVVGGGWPAKHLNLNGKSPVSEESVKDNMDLARRVLPFLWYLPLLRVWAGPLAPTPDEMPIIGEVAGHPGFYVVGGTYGFTLAPLWGCVLRDLAIGIEPQVGIQDLSPNRFMSWTEKA